MAASGRLVLQEFCQRAQRFGGSARRDRLAWAFARPQTVVLTGVGIVIMHGKGGSPTGYVSTLASSLEEKGHLVANLEMPWSGRRGYNVNVGVAEKEVEAEKEKGTERKGDILNFALNFVAPREEHNAAKHGVSCQ